jgi:hypothetical protein
MGAFGLDDWDDIDHGDWPTLLVGNGGSLAVSSKFAYDSLYTVAPLVQDDREVFVALDTTNFEEVLNHLRTASLVCRQLGHHSSDVDNRYNSIRNSLIKAVHAHHVSWPDVNLGDRLQLIRKALLAFESVFTTNYDLIIYWAIMNGGVPPGDGFGDLFWNDRHVFDPFNITRFGKKTLVYWLHGGLHLYRTPAGETTKQTSNGGTLLASFAAGKRVPLFVSEGTWRQKRRAIRRSDYLEHAYTTFAGTSGPLVVFGQTLGDSDRHLIKAILRHPRRDIAFGIYTTKQRSVNLQRAQVENHFPHANIAFFDSRTHPLGDPALRVP